MDWFVFAVVCMLGWGCADIFYKRGSENSDRYSHLRITVCVGLVMGICSFALLPFAKGIAASDLFSCAVAYSPAALGYIISMIIGYAGLRYLELSVASPVQNASGVLSAIVMTVWFVTVSKGNAVEMIEAETGFVFHGASGLSLFRNIIIAVGILSVCVGVIALAFAENKLSKEEKNKVKESERKYRYGALALIFPLLYCFFDTLGTAADGIILNESSGLELGEIDVLVLYGFIFLAVGAVSWLFLLFKEKKPYDPFARTERSKLIAAICEEFGQVFYILAMSRHPVVASPMIASYCIVSLVLSRLILKEKLTKQQYFCVFAVVFGVVLLGVSEGLSNI